MVHLYNETTGAEIGTISLAELQFLQDNLEEESLTDTDYWINPATIDMLATRGASEHLVAILRQAVGDDPNGMDIEFEVEGDRRPLRNR